MVHDDRSVYDLMVSGAPYHVSDPYLQKLIKTQRAKLGAINAEKDDATRNVMLREFLDIKKDAHFDIWMPFFCEYGHITIGNEVFLGTGCCILDVCQVTIGDRTLIGPNVQIYTPLHPLRPEERDGLRGKGWAKPVRIGNDCWIGGAAVICPGVTIGDGSTVGAGSVVTNDVESRSFVAGNPARLIRRIE